MTYPYNAIPTNNPQNITIAAPVGLERNPRDPNAQDNSFPIGTEWQNTLTLDFFKCSSATISGAVWVPFIPSAAGTVSELTGNSGGGVGPDGSGNINVVGDGTTITIAGNPGTNTLTASLVGGGVAGQSFTTDVSGPAVPTASGVLNLTGSTSTYTTGAVANTVRTEVQGTNHAVLIGKGVHTPASTIAVGTNGQVLLGASAADPAFGTLTSTASTLTYTTGANSLNIDLTIPVTVAHGGTGDTSLTAYAPVCGGTTSTGALQSASTGLSTSGYVLTSNGSSALPSFVFPGFTFVNHTDVSAGSVIIDISVFSSYVVLMFVTTGLFPSVNGEALFMVVSTDGGATYHNTGYQAGYNKNAYNSATLTNANSTAQFPLTGGIHAAGGGNGAQGYLFYWQTGVLANMQGQIVYDDTAANITYNSTIFGVGPTGADHVKFTTTSGLISNGGVTVYGLRYS